MSKKRSFAAIMLLKAKKELDEATKIQPCPACKHDMEQLSLFLNEKIKFGIDSSKMNEKTVKILKSIGCVKELTTLGILIARLLSPFVNLRAVPATYISILEDNVKTNRRIRIHLLNAMKTISKINSRDEQLGEVQNILKYFIKATDFKINASPQTFYMFDRIIRFGYQTGFLTILSKIITGTKQAVSCCMK